LENDILVAENPIDLCSNIPIEISEVCKWEELRIKNEELLQLKVKSDALNVVEVLKVERI
jgi:hypothetical protein